MAKYNRRVSDGYGITQPIPGIFPEPIEALRNPTTADRAELGQVWINTVVPNAWICVLNAGGLTTWILCAPGTSNVNTINSLAPFGGNITIAGTADQILAISAGSTVTLSLTGPYSPSTYTNHGVLIGEGTTAIHATSAGIAGQVLTSNGPLLDPTFQTAGGGGGGGTADYADFYAVMPGDNAATVAVGAAIELPNNGPSSGTSITRLSAKTFNLADIATYSISFQCSFDEAGQMLVKLNGSELVTTTSGRATGTNQVYISCLVTTTVINSVISIVNPTGNAAALTITPIAGGAGTVSAHLVIQRIAGGPGGGLLNTINSLVPVGGDILLAGTANQITATSAGHTVTYSLPAAITAPGSLTTTTSLTATLGAITATNGNLVLGTAGNKILSTSVGTLAAAGANSFGSVVLVGGTATVATTAVTANSLIVIWRQSIGATGAAAIGHLTVGTITAATSFVIRSVSAAAATALVVTDVSVVGYMIIN